jgi:PAS domain-containing protein
MQNIKNFSSFAVVLLLCFLSALLWLARRELRRRSAMRAKVLSAPLLKAGALQDAIFNSANFSTIATDAEGVIQIFNVGAQRMLGYAPGDVVNKLTPASISDAQELIERAALLSSEFGAAIRPGFDALVYKAVRGIEDIYELTYIRADGLGDRPARRRRQGDRFPADRDRQYGPQASRG